MFSVVVFCDCVDPLPRDCGEGVGDLCDRGVCVFEAVCAYSCVGHVGAFLLDTNAP